MDLESLNGFWDNEYYMVPQPDGYYRCAAIKRGDSIELTPYGESVLGTEMPSEPKKRQRVARVEPVPEFDDLDI